MKLLVIADEIQSRDDICDFTSLWNWYVVNGLRQAGAEIAFSSPVRYPPMSETAVVEHYNALPLDGIDHVLALGHRYFERIPKECVASLIKRCHGLVTQTHELDRRERSGVLTFTMCEVAEELAEDNRCVGWAADPEMLWPDQSQGELRILIDHQERHHDGTRPDISAKILRQCLVFARSGLWREWGFTEIRLRRLVTRAIEDVITEDLAPYDGLGVPFVDVCEEYRRSQLFIVTHRDIAGFSNIEAAMAGCLPVVPDGFMKADRLKTIRCVVYPRHKRIPWRHVLNSIDPKASRLAASPHDWATLTGKMMATFGGAAA